MSKVMEVICSVGRTSVRIDGENERTFDLVGGAPEAIAADLIDFARVNGCDAARVEGANADAIAPKMEAAGLTIDTPSVEAHDDHSDGEE